MILLRKELIILKKEKKFEHNIKRMIHFTFKLNLPYVTLEDDETFSERIMDEIDKGNILNLDNIFSTKLDSMLVIKYCVKLDDFERYHIFLSFMKYLGFNRDPQDLEEISLNMMKCIRHYHVISNSDIEDIVFPICYMKEENNKEKLLEGILRNDLKLDEKTISKIFRDYSKLTGTYVPKKRKPKHKKLKVK